MYMFSPVQMYCPSHPSSTAGLYISLAFAGGLSLVQCYAVPALQPPGLQKAGVPQGIPENAGCVFFFALFVCVFFALGKSEFFFFFLCVCVFKRKFVFF